MNYGERSLVRPARFWLTDNRERAIAENSASAVRFGCGILDKYILLEGYPWAAASLVFLINAERRGEARRERGDICYLTLNTLRVYLEQHWEERGSPGESLMMIKNLRQLLEDNLSRLRNLDRGMYSEIRAACQSCGDWSTEELQRQIVRTREICRREAYRRSAAAACRLASPASNKLEAFSPPLTAPDHSLGSMLEQAAKRGTLPLRQWGTRTLGQRVFHLKMGRQRAGADGVTSVPTAVDRFVSLADRRLYRMLSAGTKESMFPGCATDKVPGLWLRMIRRQRTRLPEWGQEYGELVLAQKKNQREALDTAAKFAGPGAAPASATIGDIISAAKVEREQLLRIKNGIAVFRADVLREEQRIYMPAGWGDRDGKAQITLRWPLEHQTGGAQRDLTLGRGKTADRALELVSHRRPGLTSDAGGLWEQGMTLARLLIQPKGIAMFWPPGRDRAMDGAPRRANRSARRLPKAFEQKAGWAAARFKTTLQIRTWYRDRGTDWIPARKAGETVEQGRAGARKPSEQSQVVPRPQPTDFNWSGLSPRRLNYGQALNQLSGRNQEVLLRRRSGPAQGLSQPLHLPSGRASEPPKNQTPALSPPHNINQLYKRVIACFPIRGAAYLQSLILGRTENKTENKTVKTSGRISNRGTPPEYFQQESEQQPPRFCLVQSMFRPGRLRESVRGYNSGLEPMSSQYHRLFRLPGPDRMYGLVLKSESILFQESGWPAELSRTRGSDREPELNKGRRPELLSLPARNKSPDPRLLFRRIKSRNLPPTGILNKSPDQLPKLFHILEPTSFQSVYDTYQNRGGRLGSTFRGPVSFPFLESPQRQGQGREPATITTYRLARQTRAGSNQIWNQPQVHIVSQKPDQLSGQHIRKQRLADWKSAYISLQDIGRRGHTPHRSGLLLELAQSLRSGRKSELPQADRRNWTRPNYSREPEPLPGLAQSLRSGRKSELPQADRPNWTGPNYSRGPEPLPGLAQSRGPEPPLFNYSHRLLVPYESIYDRGLALPSGFVHNQERETWLAGLVPYRRAVQGEPVAVTNRKIGSKPELALGTIRTGVKAGMVQSHRWDTVWTELTHSQRQNHLRPAIVQNRVQGQPPQRGPQNRVQGQPQPLTRLQNHMQIPLQSLMRAQNFIQDQLPSRRRIQNQLEGAGRRQGGRFGGPELGYSRRGELVHNGNGKKGGRGGTGTTQQESQLVVQSREEIRRLETRVRQQEYLSVQDKQIMEELVKQVEAQTRAVEKMTEKERAAGRLGRPSRAGKTGKTEKVGKDRMSHKILDQLKDELRMERMRAGIE